MTPSSKRPISKGIWLLATVFALAAFAYLGIAYSFTSAAPDLCITFPASVGSEAELNSAIDCFGQATTAGTYAITLTQNIDLTASTDAINNTVSGAVLEINGAGFTIDGQDTDDVRPLQVLENTTVIINDLTVTGGNLATGPQDSTNGGAGIQNLGDLTLNNSIIISNTNSRFTGGGLYNGANGTLTLNNTLVDDNLVANLDGGGIENRGTLFVYDSQIINNVSGRFSGGIGSVDTAYISGTTIANNSAGRTGGGIYNNSAIADPDGQMTIVDSEILSNTVGTQDAGGIMNDNAGDLIIRRTTISGNSAPNRNGGAIYVDGSSARTELENVTVSGNSSSGAVIDSEGVLTITHATVVSNTGSAGVEALGTLSLINSILAGHTVDCDFSGTTYSSENTLIQNTTSCTGASLSVSPKLLPLADNGGFGETHLPAEDSPVLDAASTSCAAVDQRNITRASAACELGSVELSGVSISGATVVEGTGGSTNLEFVITRSDAAIPVTVMVDTVAGTATSGVDFTPLASEEISFEANGGLTQTVAVEILTDDMVEADETLTLTMSNAQNALISVASALGTIEDDDAATLTLSGPSEIAEGDSGTFSYVFTATLDIPVDGGFSVPVTTADSTATAGSDYDALSTTLNFTGSAGEVQTGSVTINGDMVDEGDETFVVELGTPTGTTLGDSISDSGSPLTVTIQNDDAAELTISVGTTSISEEDTTIPVTVTLSNSSPNVVTVDYATSDSTAAAGEDYVAMSGTLAFAPSELTKTLFISITEDSLDELDEAFSIILSNATNAALGVPSSASITIIDDDGNPSIYFVDPADNTAPASTYTISETEGTVDVVIALSNVSGTTVSVGVSSTDGTATSGSDFTAVNENVTFVAGEITKTLSIPISNDTSYESNEAFSLSLNNPTNAVLGATSSALVTIEEDDSPPTVSVDDVTVAEGDETGIITFTISLDQIAGVDMTVGYQTQDVTAAAGEDYVAITDGSLIIPAGDLSATVVVTITGDTENETDETFELAITSVSAGTIDPSVSIGTATLTNDDIPDDSTGVDNSLYLPLVVIP